MEVDKLINNQKICPLDKCEEGITYTISKVETETEDIEKFLFTLGCFKDEKITIISRLKNNIVVTIKGARYSIDSDLAEAIIVQV